MGAPRELRGFVIRSLLLVVASVAVFHVHTCVGSYSCCSAERNGTVCTLAGGSATFLDSPNPAIAAIWGPVGVAFYPPDSIVVTGMYEHRLRLIANNGTVSVLAGGGRTGENQGQHLDSDDPLTARFSAPAGIFVDDETNVLLTENLHRLRILLRNGSVRTLAGTGVGGYTDGPDPIRADFFYPHGILSTLENGQRLIVIGGNYDHRIRVIYANRTVSTLAGSGNIGFMNNCTFKDSADPLSARFCHPQGIAIDRLGDFIIADFYGNRVRKLWRSGGMTGVTTIAGHGPVGVMGRSTDSDSAVDASFFSPVDVAIDRVGNVLVSCYHEHRVRMILVNGSVRTLAGSGPSTNLDPSVVGGFVDNVPLLQARFYRPQYIALDQHGRVILADSNNNRIRMLCTSLPHATTRSAPSPSPTCQRTKSLSRDHPSAPSLSFTSSVVRWASVTDSTTTTVSAAHTVSAASFSHPLPLLPPTAPNPILRLLSSEEGARAVVASGAAAAALAGFATTTSMGHATRMGALMRSVECAFASGELDPPSLVELPLQWSIESQGGAVGSHAGSALLTSAVLVVLPLLMCAFVHAILSSCGVFERPVLRSLQCSVLSRYCLMSLAYFAPNVLMSSVVVVGRGASSGAVVAAVCAAIVPLLLGCVAGQRALAMDVEVVPLCGGKWELRNRPSSRAYVGRRSAGLLTDVATRRRTLCACASWRMLLRR